MLQEITVGAEDDLVCFHLAFISSSKGKISKVWTNPQLSEDIGSTLLKVVSHNGHSPLKNTLKLHKHKQGYISPESYTN